MNYINTNARKELSSSFISFYFYFFIGVKLIYNAVLISAVQ